MVGQKLPFIASPNRNGRARKCAFAANAKPKRP